MPYHIIIYYLYSYYRSIDCIKIELYDFSKVAPIGRKFEESISLK